MDQRWGEGSMDDVVTGGEVSFTRRLDRWVADARIEGAAEARTRERWLRSVAEQDATFGGVLLDLAERRGSVTLDTTAGRRHHGAIEAIGADFVALRLSSGREVLVALAAVTVLRSGSVDVAVGERAVTTDLRLADVLAELAADRARVLLVPRVAGEAPRGELRSAGIDVVTLRADGDPPTPVYVRIDALSEVDLG